MEAREQRGLVIAATTKLWSTGGGNWTVPSSSNGTKYAVSVNGDCVHCTCPDFADRGLPCKHIYAVKYTITRESSTTVETNAHGETTVTQTETVTETVKVTYSQDWANYNRAQVNEKRLFLPMLADLCKGIEEPVQTFGRPRMALSDQVFYAAYKVYSTVSSRRFMSDLADAQDKGYISRLPHFNSVLKALESEAVTPVLQDLIKRSSLPLKAIETDFCVDSSGFSTSRHEKWFSVKHQGVVSKRDWVKLHAMAGVKTNIVTSVEVTGRDGADSTQFEPLVTKTATNFKIGEVSADKAYSSRANLQTVKDAGGTAFIPFKSNAIPGKNADSLWSQMYHFYHLNNAEFSARYHKRSNAETTFSMIKGKFGDAVRSKTETAQVNEVLCKVLCHNLCCVIGSIYELGITPNFAEAV